MNKYIVEFDHNGDSKSLKFVAPDDNWANKWFKLERERYKGIIEKVKITILD